MNPSFCAHPQLMRVADNELCVRPTVAAKYEKEKQVKEMEYSENTEIKRDKAHKANARHNGHLDRQIYRQTNRYPSDTHRI